MINASLVMSLNSAFILSVFGWRSNWHNTHYLIYLDVVKPQPVTTLPTLKLLPPNLTAPDILLKTSTTLASIYPLTNRISHNTVLQLGQDSNLQVWAFSYRSSPTVTLLTLYLYYVRLPFRHLTKVKATTIIPNIKISQNNVLYQKYERHKGVTPLIVRIKWVGGTHHYFLIYNSLIINNTFVL